MPISFAGQPLLLEDLGGVLHNWLDWALALGQSALFGAEPMCWKDGRDWPRTDALAKVGLPIPNYTKAPQVRLNCLWIPTGATRWSIGLFLVDQNRLEAINYALDSNGGGTLMFESGHTYRLYPLPPRQLTQEIGDQRLYLLPLVDHRWFWQYANTGNLVVDENTTWASLISSLGTQIGKTITSSAVSSNYGSPDTIGLTRRYENVALLLDAVAACVGMRVVFDPRGETVSLMNATDSLAFHATNLLAHQASIIAGGEDASPLRHQIPAEVHVVFPKAKHGSIQNDGDVYRITLAASTFLSGYQTQPSGTSKTFYDSAEADMTSGEDDPDNLSTLNSLATQIATDYYAFLRHTYDIAYAGLKSWIPTGLDDWILHRAGAWLKNAPGSESYQYSTRVCSVPYDFGISQLLHAPTTRPSAIRRFELYENLTFGGSALARKLDFDGTDYVVDTDLEFTVYDPFLKFNQNHAPYGMDGARGYAARLDDRWEIIQMEHQARWIHFVVNEPSGFDTGDASFAVDGVTLLYYDGYQPADDVEIVYNQKASTDYVFEGANNAEGWAKYDPADDKYYCDNMECPN